MASKAWFERLENPTEAVIAAGEQCLEAMRAGKAVSEDEAGELIYRAHVPWPALHASIEADIQRARERLQA